MPAHRPKADIHYMKVDDDASDSQFPVFAIVGVVIFLGIVVYAAIAFRPQPPPPEPESLNWTLKDQPKAASISQESASAGSAPAAAGGGQLQTSPAIMPESGAGSNLPTGDNRIFAIPQTDTNYRQLSYVDSDSGRVGSKFAKKNSVYFESIKFGVLYDNKNMAHLIGDIYIANDALADAQNVRLSLYENGYKYSLERYSGSVNSPKFLGPVTIPSKYVAACHVMAKAFQISDIKPGTRRIELDGWLAGAGIHVEDTIS